MAIVKYKGAVIGGGIMGAGGAGFDRPGAPFPLSHAGGYAAHPDFELVGICDPVLSPAAQAWGCPVFTSLEDLWSAAKPDIVSVAVPPSEQPALLKKIAQLKPRAVICEKPVAPDLAAAREIAALYKQANIPLIVNYSRRFVPFYAELKDRIAQDGPVLSVTIKYAKGILHNGSHAIDLLLNLFGPVVSATVLSARADYSDKDPTLAAFLALERCPMAFLQPLDDRAFTLFEVDIVTATSRTVIYNDHRDCDIWRLRDGVGSPPGKRLVKIETLSTGHERAIRTLMDNAAAVLRGTAAPLCTPSDAIAAQTVVQDLLAGRA